jgi:hypothetical protein
MQGMVRLEVERLASVGAFAINVVDQRRLIPDYQNIRKRNRTDSSSIVNWIEVLKLLRYLRKFCNRSGHEARFFIKIQDHSHCLCCAESRANFSK